MKISQISYKLFFFLVFFFLSTFFVVLNIINYKADWNLLAPENGKCKQINNVEMLKEKKNSFNFALVNIIRRDWSKQWHYIGLEPNWDVFDKSYFLKGNIKDKDSLKSVFEKDKWVEILYYQYQDENHKMHFYSNNALNFIFWIYWMNIHNMVYKIWYILDKEN